MSVNHGTQDATFELHIVRTEIILSHLAAIPIAGRLAGAAHVLLGVIQTIGALLGLILSIPFLWSLKGREIFQRSGSHFVNGLANIGAGTLEIIPILGSIIGFVRFLNGSSRDPKFGGSNWHHNKIMFVGYQILNKIDDRWARKINSNMAFIPV